MTDTRTALPPQQPVLWPFFLAFAMLLSIVLSALTPSFQTPDELDHVKRAYLLSKGQLLLHARDGNPSGGEVDTGLLSYMQQFTQLVGKRAQKLTAEELARSESIAWSGETVYQAPSGTAYYFPAVYLPQATGLAAGRVLGWTVADSYRLARYLSLAAAIALLALAFRIFAPPAGALALLVLPMTLFQFGGAVLDPVATGLTFVAVAAFMRLAVDGRQANARIFIALVAATLLVCASRAHMLPMLALPFAAAWFARCGRRFWIALALAVFVLGWTAVTIKTTVYAPGPRDADHAARLMHYLTHPSELWHMLWVTWSHPVRMSEYWESFLGVLGWLDIGFPASFYLWAGTAFLATVAASVATGAWRSLALARTLLVVVCFSAILLTFLALLVQWTEPGSRLIEGVQGRYFLIPAVCLSYALLAQPHPRPRALHLVSHLLLAGLVLISGYGTAKLLADRYYMQPVRPVALPAYSLEAGQAIATDAPTQLQLPQPVTGPETAIDSVSILLDIRKAITDPRAKASLRLWDSDGSEHRFELPLTGNGDDDYHSVPVDARAYVRGDVRIDGTAEVGLWEAVDGTGQRTSCLAVHATDGTRRVTPGCPLP